MTKSSMPLPIAERSETLDHEWVTLPGGELEGRRPATLCPACREKQRAGLRQRLAGRAPVTATAGPVLCFGCHGATVQRDRALRTAAQLDTASEARFQCQLPFEPVNRVRLERLRAERAVAREAARAGVGQYVDRRRHAQIEARHTLARIIAGVRASIAHRPEQERAAARMSAQHAAELQLPDAWLPFVAAR